jgi:hypothetical protein
LDFHYQRQDLPSFFIDSLRETLEDLELGLILDSGSSLVSSASAVLSKVEGVDDKTIYSGYSGTGRNLHLELLEHSKEQPKQY